MDWKKSAMDDLRRYPYQKESLHNMAERIAALKESYQSIKCAMSDSEPVKGGGSHIEDRMLSNIVERERLKHTYRATRQLVELTERGLAGLDKRERQVLERFYITREHGYMERLKNELGYEERQIYRMKDEALYQFTVSMYGLVDY